MDKQLRFQFEDPEQQAETATLGIWVFLSTEILFFGGLFLAYAVYRVSYPTGVDLAAKELNIGIGTANTAILLTSSLFMALAVESARNGARRATLAHLAITELLGLAFLALKAVEYAEDIRKHLIPGPNVAIRGEYSSEASLFYFIYYVMTGIHALHLAIGLALIGSLILRARRNEFSSTYSTPVEVVGLYWHFVDAVWIFLYPLLYLIGRYS